MSAEPGHSISHYRLIEKIGEGGMGIVWKAEDTVLHRTVAVKVLPADHRLDDERRRMFLDEARRAASITHGNIVQIHELGRAGELDFIVMEYVEGKPLRELLHGRPLPPEKVADWGCQLAQGVARAHRKGLLHRDLKPANILITDDGEAKVVDFGLATLFSPTDESAVDLATTMTSLGEVQQYRIAGTLPYMSPEQVRGEKLDARSDIFSLGSILYEMATGERPFVGPEPATVAQAIVRCQPRPIHECVPSIPRSLLRIIEKLMARHPVDRYQGLEDAAVDLKQLRRELASGTSPSYQDTNDSTVESSRRWMPVLASFLAVGVLAMAGLWAVSRKAPAISTSAAAEDESTVAVFSFENLKDPTDPDRLGQILQELIVTDLSRLDALHVLSSQRLFDLRKQVAETENPAGKELNTAVALKAGAGRMLTGSLSQLGETWIVAAQMIAVATGEVVQSSRIDGTDLYTMVDDLTAELQANLRIAQPVGDLSVREQTSSSLEAYRLYLEGNEMLYSDIEEAARFYRAALAIDPDFGQAYYRLAVALGWRVETRQEAKPILDEFLARELYTSEKEKRMAEAARASRELHFAEALPILRQLATDYPDEKDIWYELGETLFHAPDVGDRDEAMQAFERSVELDPDFLLPYHHIFDTLQARGSFRRALAESRHLLRRFPENRDLKQKRLYYAIRDHDAAESALALDEALRTAASGEERLWVLDAAGRAHRDNGDYEESLDFFQQALAMAMTPELEGTISERIDEVEVSQRENQRADQ